MKEQEQQTQGPQTFVNVPVPVERVMDVYAFLGRPYGSAEGEVRSENGAPDSPWTPTASSNNLPNRRWTEKDLARFMASGTKTARTVAAMMDVLVEHPGRQVTTTELVERLGVSRNELRGVLAALTRHIHKHYARANWPLVFTWGPTLGDSYPAEAHYSIVDEDVIAAWAKLRQQG